MVSVEVMPHPQGGSRIENNRVRETEKNGTAELVKDDCIYMMRTI
jgi:hypothetical protein